MRLSEIAKIIGEHRKVGEGDPEIADVTNDSRESAPDKLYIAIRGSKVDGHSFIRHMDSKSIAALIVEELPAGSPEVPALVVPDTREALLRLAAPFYNYPSRKLKLVGVTGTNGKTTTTWFIRSVFEAAGEVAGLIGTIAYYTPGGIFKAPNTSPEATVLQRLLARMVNEKATGAVMEVSSHAIKLDRIRGCEFAAAVYTNLSVEHTEFHPTMEDYLETKLGLFKRFVKKVSENYEPFAVINRDDKYFERVRASCNYRTISYGFDPDAEVRAVEPEYGLSGTSYTLCYRGEKIPVRLKLAGKFNISNSLAAASVGIGFGIGLDTIKNGLENLERVPGRFDKVDVGQPYQVVVDYAHTPEGLRNVIEAARELKPARLIVVFGCGGDRSREKRPKMGEVVFNGADLAVVTSDNPRSEEPLAIINDILVSANKSGANYIVEVDRAKAIEIAINEARAGDIVLIAGKGHEDYQIFKDRTVHFDDREVALEVLKKKHSFKSASMV